MKEVHLFNLDEFPESECTWEMSDTCTCRNGSKFLIFLKQLCIPILLSDVRDVLAEFDVDESGTLTSDELANAARLFRNYRLVQRTRVLGCMRI